MQRNCATKRSLFYRPSKKPSGSTQRHVFYLKVRVGSIFHKSFKISCVHSPSMNMSIILFRGLYQWSNGWLNESGYWQYTCSLTPANGRQMRNVFMNRRPKTCATESCCTNAWWDCIFCPVRHQLSLRNGRSCINVNLYINCWRLLI